MPFDGKDFPLVAVPTVKPFDFDTATPDERLLELARLLENEQEWRSSLIEWDYSESLYRDPSAGCGTAGCALGLASIAWRGFGKLGSFELSRASHLARMHFAMTERDVDHIFIGGFTRLEFEAVTPGMVAAAIREFVAKRQS